MTLPAVEPPATADPAATALLVTASDELLDDLLRLAAAAGVIPDVAADSAAALRSWPTAGLVIVGADLAGRVAECRPPRRERVHVVSPGPAADPLFRTAVALGASNVVELPAADAWLVDLFADAADGHAVPATTIGVLAGSGGAGSTTFACALALTGAADGATLLVDADPFGGGAERVVGLEEEPGVRWDALVGSGGRLGSRALREALPRRGSLALLGFPAGDRCRLDVATAREAVSAARRGHRLVVLDLPRRFDEVTTWLMTACDSLVLVVRPDVPAAAAAGRVLHRIREVAREPSLVVRRRGPVPAVELADLLGAPLLAEMPEHRRLAEWVDLGLGPVHRGRGPCAAAARTALRRLMPAPVVAR